MDPQLLLPLGAGLVVEQVQLCDEIVHVTVRREESGAICPRCGVWSEAFHSSYERGLADLPIAGRQAVIDLRVRRFRCHRSDCPRKTFVEQAPVLADRYAHRTHRLRSMLQTIGFSLGGRPGSRHCKRLAMPASRTTLLRLVRARVRLRLRRRYCARRAVPRGCGGQLLRLTTSRVPAKPSSMSAAKTTPSSITEFCS